MKMQILVTSVYDLNQYDITELVVAPSWITGTESQAGKLEFDMLEDSSIFVKSGDIVEFQVDGKKIFKGKVFMRKKTENKRWTITSYDNLRYLKSEDTVVFNASSVSERFKKICKLLELPYKILENVSYKCPAAVMDQSSYFSMLETSLDETKVGYGGMRYGIRDNYGKLEFFSYNQMITKLVIGDDSLMTSYSYDASIDDAYNSIKVIRENDDNKKREIYTAKSDKTIEKWGKLQKVENASDADMNASQLQKQANDLLRESNIEKKSLSLDAVGNISIQAGNSFILRLKDLTKDGVGKDSLALVKQCTHQFDVVHTMSLEVEVLA